MHIGYLVIAVRDVLRAAFLPEKNHSSRRWTCQSCEGVVRKKVDGLGFFVARNMAQRIVG